MRGLSLEFKKQFEKVRKEQVDVLGRTVQYAYLNSSEINAPSGRVGAAAPGRAAAHIR